MALSAGALISLAPASFGVLTFVAVACALSCTTAVAWRRRNPVLAAVVAATGLAGYACLTHDHDTGVEPFAVLLTFYTAGARGITRRQLTQLAALLAYGILACVTVAAAIGELTVANLAAHGSVITVVPAAAGVIVARQRNLAQRLAAANEQLRHEQELRLATVAARERNRVARELHDVVAHGVSVMVVQAGAARITLRDEPVMARAALRALAGERTHMVRELDSSVAERVSGMIVLAEATDAMASADPEAAISSIARIEAAGRAALRQMRQILGLLRAEHDPAELRPLLGIEHIHDLVGRSGAGGLVDLTVTGSPGLLLGGIDVTAYRLVAGLLSCASRAAAGHVTIGLHFRDDTVELAVALQESFP